MDDFDNTILGSTLLNFGDVEDISMESEDALEEPQISDYELISKNDHSYLVSNEMKELDSLNESFQNAKEMINYSYLKNLVNLPIAEIDERIKEIDINDMAMVYKINKLIYNKEENKLHKLMNVLYSVYADNASIATILCSDGNHVDFYLAAICKHMFDEIGDERNIDWDKRVEVGDIIKDSFLGNFNGSDLTSIGGEQLNTLMETILDNETVTSISCIASLRDEKKAENQNYIQGIENLIDSLQGKTYNLLILADAVTEQEIEMMREGYESLYSELAPYGKKNVTINEGENYSLSDTFSSGSGKTIVEGISKTQGNSSSSGWSISDSTGTSTGETKNGGGNLIFVNAGINKSETETIQHTSGTNNSTTENSSDTTNTSESNMLNEQFSKMKSSGTTTGKSLQMTYDNKSVSSLLEDIEDCLKRLKACRCYGGFHFAAYVLSPDKKTNTICSSAYLSLMRGENSGINTACINTWCKSTNCLEESGSVNRLKDYLRLFTHPVFYHENMDVTPSQMISGSELALHIGLPKTSVAGIGVYEGVSFGRNLPVPEKSSIHLGHFYHMGSMSEQRVRLDVNSLTKHTFITGSTGSGKSNTIYFMLNELRKQNVHFLVIEPAKGEYKNVFGNDPNVHVFGTNPYVTELLRLNPFAFPKGIHVLEHIDRLIEIFNACWPMYSAMPAVLKEAVEESYKNAGWNLNSSINEVSEKLFPSFIDVLSELYVVVNNSAFSEEVKGNYIGSLVTRVKSLTNGINGMIFTNDELSYPLLFDTNAIVDISRIGSMETKSLIMGILVMKLQEFRTSIGGMNLALQHVTVLEEAHNLLKRTNTEVSSESSNIAGKAVEMIGNMIAELRTYGEGFIIADQSPQQMDMSVIRNTNTKIIMSLPSEDDRILTGKSIGLNDNQIRELAKLETGVAAVYQNQWQEAGLCKIGYYAYEPIVYQIKEQRRQDPQLRTDLVKILIKISNKESIDQDIDAWEKRLLKAEVSVDAKKWAIHLIKNRLDADPYDVSHTIYSLLNNDHVFEKIVIDENIDQLNETLLRRMNIDKDEFSIIEQGVILRSVVNEKSKDDVRFKDFTYKWNVLMENVM